MPRGLCLGIGVDILHDCAQTRPTMAKVLFHPVRRLSAKAKAKDARKVTASGRAKPARKQVATAARSAKRVTSKPARRAVKTTGPARTPGTKQAARTASMKKPATKRTSRALATAEAPKQVAKNALAKPLPAANAKRAARPQATFGNARAPVPAEAVRLNTDEMGVRLSGKRAEKALVKRKARSVKNGGVELRKVELTPAEAEARKTRLKNLIVL